MGPDLLHDGVSGPASEQAADAHYLLPNYDEYLIAYRDRGARSATNP